MIRSAFQGAGSEIVWVADIDDTLIDTAGAHEVAAGAVRDRLSRIIDSPLAEMVTARFIQLFQTLLSGHQEDGSSEGSAYDVALQRVMFLQQDIRQEWGTTKKFSRECLLKMAGDDHGVPLTAEQLQECIDAYWDHMTANVIVFEDAVRLCSAIGRLGHPLFLMTSSDGRLALGDNGQFEYDPGNSHDFKLSRISVLEKKQIEFRQAFVGDPDDKPTPAFFENVYNGIEQALGRTVSPKSIVVIGDSYPSDIEYPEAHWDLALGVLYKRSQDSIRPVSERVVSVGTFDDITAALHSSV